MNSIQSIVKVGIAEMDIAVSPQVIRTIGLGSCVGVVVYDPWLRAAALAHVMLPDSSLAKGNAANPAKFADLAVEELVKMLMHKGSKGRGLKAKLAGGAQMFQSLAMSEAARIGPRNVEEVERQLARLGIEKVAADVGGNSGRTIEFDPEREILQVRTVYKEAIEI
ncbi:MAG TPA: chemotaxis protein CheD [Bacillales bacterium]